LSLPLPSASESPLSIAIISSSVSPLILDIDSFYLKVYEWYYGYGMYRNF
jgi:hypothetical protein